MAATYPNLFSGPTFAPLRHRAFAGIWAASLFSNSGSVIQTVGASWTMTTIAPTADYVALVQAAAMAPTMLLSLVTGALADTVDRRKLMLIAQIVMLIVSAVLAVMTWAGLLTVWSLLLFTFLIGCGSVTYAPAWQASILEQVPRKDLQAAVALNSINFNLARTAAPAIGGVLVAIGGGALAFTVNALSYVGLIGMLARWKKPPVERTIAPEHLGPAIRAGLRYVSRAPQIRATLIRGMVLGLGGGPLWSLMPLVAKDLLGGGPLVYGWLLGAFGAGAMAGGFMSVRIRAAFGLHRVMVGGSVVFALSSVVVGVSSLTAVSLLAMLAAGGAWVLAISTFNTVVQTSSPEWVRGRALSMYQMVTFGALALGSVLWGQAAAAAGLREALIAAGGLLLAAQVAAALLLPRSVEEMDLDPFERPAYRTPALELTPETGPIVITVEYEVPPENQAAFVATAREIGHIRLRNGASRWSLLQDIDKPQTWVEQFSAPSWVDHQRQLARFTNADQHAREELLKLHSGGARVVRRYAERRADTFRAQAAPRPPADPEP